MGVRGGGRKTKKYVPAFRILPRRQLLAGFPTQRRNLNNRGTRVMHWCGSTSRTADQPTGGITSGAGSETHGAQYPTFITYPRNGSLNNTRYHVMSSSFLWRHPLVAWRFSIRRNGRPLPDVESVAATKSESKALCRLSDVFDAIQRLNPPRRHSNDSGGLTDLSKHENRSA
jgi:hypothetical protein